MFMVLAALPWGVAMLRIGWIARAHVTRVRHGVAEPDEMDVMASLVDAMANMARDAQTGLEAAAVAAAIIGIAHVGVSQRPGEAGARGWVGFGWMGLLAGTAMAGSVVLQVATGPETASALLPLTLGIAACLVGVVSAWRRWPEPEPLGRAVAPVLTYVGIVAGSVLVPYTLVKEVLEATPPPRASMRAEHGGVIDLDGPCTLAVDVTIPGALVDAAYQYGSVRFTFEVQRAGTSVGHFSGVRWPDGSVTRRHAGPLRGCVRGRTCRLTLLASAPWTERGEHVWRAEAVLEGSGPAPGSRVGVGLAWVDGPPMSMR